MKNEEYYIRGKIVAVCEATLAEEIGVIAASRRLSALGSELFDGRHEAFILFDAVDTETDYPSSRQRAQDLECGGSPAKRGGGRRSRSLL